MYESERPEDTLIAYFSPIDNSLKVLMRYGGLSVLLIGPLLGLLTMSVSIVPSEQSEINMVVRLLLFLYGVGATVSVAIAGAGFFITACDLSVNPGISATIHYIGFLKKTIPTRSIYDVRQVKVELPKYHLTKPALNKSATAFVISGLPFIHRLAGLYYRAGFKPILVVTEHHKNHEQLISELSKMTTAEETNDSSTS